MWLFPWHIPSNKKQKERLVYMCTYQTKHRCFIYYANLILPADSPPPTFFIVSCICTAGNSIPDAPSLFNRKIELHRHRQEGFVIISLVILVLSMSVCQLGHNEPPHVDYNTKPPLYLCLSPPTRPDSGWEGIWRNARALGRVRPSLLQATDGTGVLRRPRATPGARW